MIKNIVFDMGRVLIDWDPDAIIARLALKPEDAGRMAEVFELLLGDDLSGRKEHIAEVGSQYLDLADLS